MTDAREIIALQEFAKWAIREGAFQGADLDGLSIQEKAHELGLIEATTYDPEQHGSSDAAETGDEWFVFAPILTTIKALSASLASERAAHAETKDRLAEVEKALETFAEIAGEPWADENGWTNAACQNDRICDWFGPSDFFAARRVREGGKT